MANSNENFLFIRSDEADNNDPWDDTILIRAYDAAIENCERACKNETSDVMESDPEPLGPQKSWKKWDRCRAVYSVDGLTYEAIIINIQGDKCTVRFKGYGNKESVLLSSLTKSKGSQAIKAQIRCAESEKGMKWEEASETGDDRSVDSQSTSRCSARDQRCPLPEPMMPPPPPPPMFSKRGETPVASEAYHAMLMSWYMSGYHTGYYDCLKQTSKN